MQSDSLPEQLSNAGPSLHSFSLNMQHRELSDEFGKEIIWNLPEPALEEAEVQQNETMSTTPENMLSVWPWPCAHPCIPLGWDVREDGNMRLASLVQAVPSCHGGGYCDWQLSGAAGRNFQWGPCVWRKHCRCLLLTACFHSIHHHDAFSLRRLIRMNWLLK